ncbi:MAG: ATP-binding protein [Acidimicrobiia bacterium]|nr:ATP-binding protein [Acidimicrobiia bacterium]
MPTVSDHDQELAADPSAARAARGMVVAVLGTVLDTDALDRALLCTSEVVTNAIEHGVPPFGLRIEQEDDTTVRILVRDASPTRPSLVEADQHAVRGRGIYIVDRCADRWGIEPDPASGGKVVWLQFDVH